MDLKPRGRDARKAAGLCYMCGAIPNNGHLQCEPCLEKHRIINRRYYHNGGSFKKWQNGKLKK